MRKKKAARKLSPKEARARHRVAECDFAREIARWIAKADDYWQRAANAVPDSNEQHTAIQNATNFNHMVVQRMTLVANRAKLHRLIADMLDGKPIGARFDDAILKALEKAMCSPTRAARRSMNLTPLSSEVDDKLSVVLTEMGYKKGPHKDSQLRRLKVLRPGMFHPKSS